MSAQIKWVPPVELTVDRDGDSDRVDPDSNAPPILLSGELQDGDDVRDFSSSDEQAEYSQDLNEKEADDWSSRGEGRAFRWFVLLSLLFLIAVVVEDTILFLAEQFARHTILGWGFSLVATGVGLALLVVIVREIGHFRSLRKINTLQIQATDLRHEGCCGNAVRFAAGVMKFYKNRRDLDAGWQRFHDSLDSNLGDREILTLFSSNVLLVLDKKAYDIVVKDASVAALLTALSPMAWLDALLFFWRNVRMIRHIAACYGFRPGFVGSIVLVKEVLKGMVASAATDFLTDEAAESVGSSVTAVLFAKVGQGMANGLLTARLGVQAMRLCRPVPFLPEESPSLRRVRGEMMDQVKKRLATGDR
jgi:putative membrane protein